jgi:hypothetical protein
MKGSRMLSPKLSGMWARLGLALKRPASGDGRKTGAITAFEPKSFAKRMDTFQFALGFS